MNKTYTIAEMANMIDNTNLKQFLINNDWKELCEISNKYGFKTVAINNAGIGFCAEQLKESSVVVDAAVSFPLGQSTLETKLFETRDAIAKGASEVDYVINIVELKNKNYDYIENEMKEIVDICKKSDIVSKVIFENCFLTNDEKIKLCEIALKVKPDFIKTSTGFGTGGATIEDVKLMKKQVGEKIKIKAAGGIRSAKDFIAMIEAGADRIGTSAGVKIIDELRAEK